MQHIIDKTRAAWGIHVGAELATAPTQKARMEGLGMATGKGTRKRTNRPMGGFDSGNHPPHDWPGKGHGVRQPMIGETRLSWHEVVHGINKGVV